MKLAIFGDSFADDKFFKESYKSQGLSWIDHIKQTDLYSIDNFSQRGASLWWCYQQFLNHQKDYDKIIFLVTFPNRITLPDTTNLTIRKHQQPYNVELHLQFADDTTRSQYKLIQDYYNNIHDRDRELFFHDTLVEKIQMLRPDAILYPCSKRSIPSSLDLPLLDIMQHEDTAWGGFDLSFRSKGADDTRMCHMIEENNTVIGHLFLDKLNGINKAITIGELFSPNCPREQYLTKVRWGT
jgi:hypothetical protein